MWCLILSIAVVVIAVVAHLVDLDEISCILGFVGMFATVLLVAAWLIQLCTANNEYEKTAYEREILVYRLENRGTEMTGNELLYSEIVDFNNELRRIKRGANNSFASMLYNKKIANGIDYIEIDTGAKNDKNPVCPNCDKTVDTAFCSDCGWKNTASKFCTDCGHQLESMAAKFCSECGAPAK